MLCLCDGNLMVRKINAFSQTGSSILNNSANINFYFYFYSSQTLCKLFYFVPKLSHRHGNRPFLPHPSPDNILAYNKTKKKLALCNGDKCNKCGIWYSSHSRRLLTGLTWCTLVLLSLLSHWKLAFGRHQFVQPGHLPCLLGHSQM